MRLAYFDCFAGAAGDMIVAALLDAGADFDKLSEAVGRLGLSGVSVRREAVRRHGIAGTRFIVETPHEHSHRHLGDITAIIEAAGLSATVAEQAKAVFGALGRAEAQVHQIPLNEVHFHEVGAADTIVDIVAACAALEQLTISQVICSPVSVGSGTVRCEHGVLPVPAPATAELLRGVPTLAGPGEGESTTPTGAALLRTWAASFGAQPAMAVEAVGYGAGSRESEVVPNLLRVMIGSADEQGQTDSAIELSANVDDSTGEVLGAAIEKLLVAGALDAWASPIVMKKSRPAWLLSALVRPGQADAAERLILTETTSFGVRRRPCTRRKLVRHFESVETPYGPIRIKIGTEGAEVLTASPEFEDCRCAAEAHHVSVREVMAAAQAVWRRQAGRQA